EVSQRTAQWCHRPWRQRTESATWPKVFQMVGQHLDVRRFPFATLQAPEDVVDPGQSITTRCAPATGLVAEKAHQVAHHAHRAGPVIEDDHCAGGQSTA